MKKEITQLNPEKSLKTIFRLIFDKENSISINDNFEREINERRTRIFNKDKPDSYFFETLVRDIHNAGMKAKVVTSKLPYIRKAFSDFDIIKVSKYDDNDLKNLMNNPKIIRREIKLKSCIANSRKMKAYSEKYGSFGEYLDQKKSDIAQLKRELMEFKYVKDAVSVDFLKDIGMDLIKPDRHVLRIFFRLGLISSENSFNEAITVAEAFRRATNERLSVIDSVFWMYGGSGDGHLQKAICTKNNPLCEECPVTNYCSYYKV